MQTQSDSTRILRIAGWTWIGFLLAMAVMDAVLYTQVTNPFPSGIPVQPFPPLDPQVPPNVPAPNPMGNPLVPVFIFYLANGFVAFLFLAFAHWDWIQDKLGSAFYPLLLLEISTAPIFINVLVTPRFPNGPLANAEGMALRQLPVLFVALALVAWEYQLPHVIFYSIATTALELGLIYIVSVESNGIFVFLFIASIRTISFIAIGLFISLLVARLREQRESLREANANLAHYASTLEQLTVSRERNRLARELHDTLAHSLTAISVSLETAKAYFDIDPDKTRSLIDKSLEATRNGVEETRRALKALRSNALEDLGLGPALRQLAESTAARFHLDFEIGLPTPMPSLSPDVEQTIYRVAQEALENIANHSRANKFIIRLESGNRVTLTIQDNGIGFDMRSREVSGHFGLLGMRERAELAGGALKIESQKGKGAKVALVI
ncbi:MAG: sensor histidine kinase [Chloroflexi bacterium]|nr:sensor histidine kinase [Chloroflexota bacterium]